MGLWDYSSNCQVFQSGTAFIVPVVKWTSLNHESVCQLLTCWFSFCWCILGRLVEMEFSISLHLEDGRLAGGNDSLFSLSSPLVSPLSKNVYEHVN